MIGWSCDTAATTRGVSPTHLSHHSVTHQQKRVSHHVGNSDSHTLFNLLTSPQLFEQVEELLLEHRERLYPPTEALSMFLSQALSADGSCQQVVNDAMAKHVISSLKPGKTETGAYYKARAHLPLSLASTLTRHAGEIITSNTTSKWRWQGSPVRLVGGTTVTLADTEKNNGTIVDNARQYGVCHG